MSVVVVGIEHTGAPLELLERVTMSDADVAKALGALRSLDNVAEAVVLSTCLRTEIYAVVDRFHEAIDQMQELLATHAGVEAGAVEERTSVRFDDDVALHLFSVAAGLESAVLGESEVLGQVRRAWERARQEGASGPVLAELFRYALGAGKRTRTETGIARGTTSFSHAAVDLAGARRTTGLSGAQVVVVGAGEVGTGVVRALLALTDDRRPASLVVVNRSAARATELVGLAAGRLPATTSSFEHLASALSDADVVFSCLQTDGHLLTAAMLEHAADRPRGVLVVDLGVPRNVEPSAGLLPGVTLFDMDHLRTEVTHALEGRRGEATLASQIVAEEVLRYRASSRERGAAPVVSALRSHMEAIRQAELERHRSALSSLDPLAREHVDSVTRAVLAKMLHGPSVLLRETSGTARGERLVEALRALFDL